MHLCEQYADLVYSEKIIAFEKKSLNDHEYFINRVFFYSGLKKILMLKFLLAPDYSIDIDINYVKTSGNILN